MPRSSKTERTHSLESQQFLPIPLVDAWSFFATPKNLARITPPDMGFEILEPFEEVPMYPGMIIRYKLHPLLRLPMTWVTRIATVDPMRSFTDTQLKGPYKLWHHEHIFEAVPGGVMMHDKVRYALPFGPIGELAHRTFIRSRIEHIFEYRKQVLTELFPLSQAA